MLTLVVTASLEIAGKLLFDNGLASRMRPRKYYTVSRESLETSLDDIEQLINFFIIEGQRVLFAENIYATIAVGDVLYLTLGKPLTKTQNRCSPLLSSHSSSLRLFLSGALP